MNYSDRRAADIQALIFCGIGFIFGFILAGIIYSPDSAIPSQSCIHAPTPQMGTFVGQCVYEGYSFYQCYYAAVDALEHGGEVIQMPVTWA